MSREKKKGTSGNAKAFITRAKALKKLQLSLEEFRRLCILKGIYPRDPKKKLEGQDKTYYLRKDIDFLAHERLISTIRQQNSHHKKEVKARAKRRIDILKRLALSKPKARLDHLVVERYPHFTDAVRELDDPLCIIALFANLPADHRVGISPKNVTNCQRLLKEFHNFVAETNALKRVFVSIKGYYFQAKVAGELVTWVSPHRFSQVLPADVDYSVMLTFLELYECILSFVNFKLYTSENLAYPPKIGRVAFEKGLELSSVEVEKLANEDTTQNAMDAIDEPAEAVTKVSDEAVARAQKIAMEVQAEEGDEESDHEDDAESAEEAEEGEDVNGEKADDVDDTKENDIDEQEEEEQVGIFGGKAVVLGREVPYIELEFMLKASGAARVTREDDLPTGPDRLASYSHWIIDRPKIVGKRNMAIEYVQPQYVFDSINAGMLLPTSLYGPGANLPPHLSPFVTEEDDGGYRPWFKDVLERIKAGDTSVVAEAAAVVYAEGEAKAEKQNEKQNSKMSEEKSKDGDRKGKKKRKPGRKESQRKDEDTAMDGEDVIVELSEEEDAVDEEGEVVEDGQDDTQMDAEEMSDESEEEEEDTDEGGEESEEEEEEDDEEGEEKRIEKEEEVEQEKENKEMAAVMLSRKKLKQYNRQKKQEEAKSGIKKRLVAKRKQLETEREAAVGTKSSSKRRKK